MANSMSNKRKKSNKSLVKHLESSEKSWSDLPTELLVQIFFRLDHVKYVFWVLSSVCRNWQLACWELLFWNSNDALILDQLKSFVDGLPGRSVLSSALITILNSIFYRNGNLRMDTCRNRVSFISLPDYPLSDKQLLYVAQRAAKPEKLIIPDMQRITGKGFSRAIRKWKQLTVLGIGTPHPSQITHVINEIGINCKALKELQILPGPLYAFSFYLDEYNAVLIKNSICSLEVLRLMGARLIKLGLLVLMKKCKKLKEVHFSECLSAFDENRIGRKALVMPVVDIYFDMLKREGNEWIIETGSGRQDAFSEIEHVWTEGDKRVEFIKQHFKLLY